MTIEEQIGLTEDAIQTFQSVFDFMHDHTDIKVSITMTGKVIGDETNGQKTFSAHVFHTAQLIRSEIDTLRSYISGLKAIK